MVCNIEQIKLERYHLSSAIQHHQPRISWRYSGDARDWRQGSCELRTVGRKSDDSRRIDGDRSVFLDWPFSSIESRERFRLEIRAQSQLGDWTAWSTVEIEASLLHRRDWSAGITLGPVQTLGQTKRPFLLHRTFRTGQPRKARLYVTALGLYEATINGHRVGDHVLAPGWQSYKHRLHYQTFDVTALLDPSGENVFDAWVGEGWYAGRLGWRGGRRDIFGSDIGLIAQLEVDGEAVFRTGEPGWVYSWGPIITGEIYDGEHVDFRQSSARKWSPAREGPLPNTRLISPEGPPVKRQERLEAIDMITSPSGKQLLDFGQNLVGYVTIIEAPPNDSVITLRHAEVLENGELGVRPLRQCAATDRIVVAQGSELIGWEPKFTFHGFRYVEVSGWEGLTQGSLSAVVVHTALEQIGDFECSHSGITKFHKNTLWGLKGNLVSVPTDCPQRDERMGWTGDLQVSAVLKLRSLMLRSPSGSVPDSQLPLRYQRLLS